MVTTPSFGHRIFAAAARDQLSQIIPVSDDAVSSDSGQGANALNARPETQWPVTVPTALRDGRASFVACAELAWADAA
jgi:hypothetical protein